MNINIKGTNIELTSAITEYAHKKISVLEKYVEPKHEGAVFHVEVGKTTQHHRRGDVFRAEIRIIGAGLDLYVVKEAEDLYAAIDLVENETARELKRVKGRREHLARRGERVIKDIAKGFPWGMERLKFKGFKKK